MTTRSSTWLLADIGGTNSRLALWNDGEDNHGLSHLVTYRNDDFSAISAVFKDYLANSPTRPKHAVLAVAGPVINDDIALANRDWQFNRIELSRKLNLDVLDVYNDFFAQALAVTELDEAQKIALGDFDRSDIGSGTIAVLGPGTGLGIAGLSFSDKKPSVICGEGGHMNLSIANDAEAAIAKEVRSHYGHCCAEQILSGDGLELLHKIMHGDESLKAAEISELAQSGDHQALETFQQFFQFLASVASDVALCFGATGGVYISGGVAYANRRLLRNSAFRERFVDKGTYQAYLEPIPCYIVNASDPALYGLAAYARQRKV